MTFRPTAPTRRTVLLGASLATAQLSPLGTAFGQACPDRAAFATVKLLIERLGLAAK